MFVINDVNHEGPLLWCDQIFVKKGARSEPLPLVGGSIIVVRPKFRQEGESFVKKGARSEALSLVDSSNIGTGGAE